ncbi:MAG: cobalamin biosynthesis protein CbiX [Rhodobacterales bacterium]|nr:cobalamin biosynthesis protein CbiX [Rhodobacterales bacterium]MDX5500243.1 cobalamin biosynthesis protein CbiX [Rhodobacterales bacterium]
MPAALIVAHGSPADPAPQEAALQALAAQVGAHLPGWTVLGATLAMPGALETALDQVGPDAMIYPFFMAQGWFTGRELPRRLTAAGARGRRQLDPFGTDPDLPALMARVATDGAATHGLPPRASTLLLAAHGSKVSRTSADSTYAMADHLRRLTDFAHIEVGFVEESPFLDDAARIDGPALCLPFFALRAGHVAGDVPEALAKAGFSGPLLPAIGEHPQAAALIAAALMRQG